MSVLFHGGAVLLPGGDAGPRAVEDGWVLVEGEKIAQVGSGPLPAALPAGVEKRDLKGGLLMPGLVNAHTHAAMTIFRGLADDKELMDWLNNYIFPAEKHLTADWVKWGTLLACAEMIRSGTTCMADMYLFIEAVADAVATTGMRAVIGEVLYNFTSRSYGDLENGYSLSSDFCRKWRGHPTIHPAMDAHAPYTCSPELLQKAHAIAVANDAMLHVHVAETQFEYDSIKEKYGATPLQHLANLGLADERLMAAHMVWLSDEELDLVAANGVKVLHNPISNLKLASGVARVPEMLARGVCVGLGTDGAASNNSLDLFEEMKAAACLHKWNSRDATAVSAEQAVAMATNAAAVGLGETAGKIAPGMAADLIVVDFSAPHMHPCHHRVSQIVYAARGSDVRDVMVNGKWLMRDRELLTIDEERVIHEADRVAGEVRAAIGK